MLGGQNFQIEWNNDYLVELNTYAVIYVANRSYVLKSSKVTPLGSGEHHINNEAVKSAYPRI